MLWNRYVTLIIPSVMKITTNTCHPALTSFFPMAISCGNVLFHVRADRHQRVVLVDLALLREEDAAALLSAPEQAHLAQLRHPKRRQQWLGGRMAAKAAVLSSVEPEHFRALTILPDAHGRPVISGLAAERTTSLSITHSGHYAAALATHSASCGLDLQELSDRLPVLARHFATPDELRLLVNTPELGNTETGLTLLWAVKEALKKSRRSDQPGTFTGIAVQRIVAAHEHVWHCSCAVQGEPQQHVMAYNYVPYMLALTCSDTSPARVSAADSLVSATLSRSR